MKGTLQAALLAAALVVSGPVLAEDPPEVRAKALADASMKEWDQTLRLLLAKAAVETSPTQEAVSALYAALAEQSETAVLRHPKPVRSAAFTADDAHVVTACDDGSLRVWSDAGAIEDTSAPGRPVLRAWPLGAADRVVAAVQGASPDVADVVLWKRDAAAAGPVAPVPLLEGVRLADVAVSPAGDAVAAIGADGTGNLWDRDGKLVRSLPARTVSMSPKGGAAVFVTPEGKAMLAGVKGAFRALDYGKPVTHAEFGPSGAALVWGDDVRVLGFAGDGRKLFEVRHPAPVEGACTNAAGDLVTVGGGSTFACYETNGRQRQSWPKEGAFTCAGMSAGRLFIATVDGGRRLTYCFEELDPRTTTLTADARSVELIPQGFHVLVRLATGRPLLLNPNLSEVGLLGGNAAVAALHPTGSCAVAGSEKGGAILQPFFGPPGGFLLGHRQRVTDAAFSRAGDRAVTASLDGTVRTWALQPQGTESIQPMRAQECWGANWSWTHDRVAAFSWDEAHFTDGRGREVALARHPQVISCAAPGDERVAVTVRDGTAAYLYTRDGKLVGEMPFGSATAGVVTNQKGDRFAVWGSASTEIRFFDARGKSAGTIDVGLPVVRASLSPDGKRLCVACSNGAVRVYPATGGARPTAEWTLPAAAAWVDFLPKGERVVTLRTDATALGLWTSKGQHVADLAATGPVVSYGWSSTGDAVVVASGDHTARIFDAAGRPGPVLRHPASVQSGMFLPDDRRILTTSADGTARLWSREGALLAAIPAHEGRTCRTAGFDRTGEWIVTAGDDHRARIWPGTVERLLETAAVRAFRDFTDDERRQYAALLRK